MRKRAAMNRRDFLRLMSMAGGAAALSPLLNACAKLPMPTSAPSPIPTPTEDSLLASVRGLGVDAFFQESYRRWMKRDPESLTTLGLAGAYGVGDANLTDISDVFIRQTQLLERETLALLRQYDRSSLTEPQSVTADIYEWFLDDLVRGHPFMYDDYPVNPTVTSIPYNLFMLFTVYHPLNNVQEADDYVSRLAQVGTKLDQLIDGLDRRLERGVILPAFLLQYVLSDIESLAAARPAAHPYFARVTGRLKGVSGDDRKTLSAQAQDEVQRVVIPAYARLSGALRNQQGKAPNRVGVWQFADGAAYYAQCLRRHTTTDKTVDEIHELGKQNLERIQAEMRSLFITLGYPAEASIPRLFDRLTADSGLYTGQAAVKAYEDAIGEAEAFLPQAFRSLPRAKVKVIGGRDGDYYMPASFDGSRPGLFFARTDASSPRFGFKTTAFHETVPGHHLQISVAQETPDLPDLRRGMQFNAYAEGWALYAERLMWELGAYAQDPQGDLGRLRMEAFRAARLVVDTGIHAMRWTFDQAVHYMMDAAGFPLDFAQSEMMRYSVWPGQAASYYVGFLKLLDLRQRAKDALGARFDLKAFHGVVLASGSVPLSVLERLIDAYIASNR